VGVLAISEGVTLGLLGLLGICVTAGASVLAAWLAHRVRRENASQHDTSQQLLGTLADAIDDHGRKLDHVADRIETVASRVDHAHTRIDNHRSRTWRWFR